MIPATWAVASASPFGSARSWPAAGDAGRADRVASPDRGAEPERTVVRRTRRGALVGDTRDGDHRAERLLALDARLARDARQDGWLVEPPCALGDEGADVRLR